MDTLKFGIEALNSIDRTARILGCGSENKRRKGKRKAKSRYRPGRSSVLKMIADGALDAVRDGARTKITGESILKRIAALPRVTPHKASA
jgi:hypothetical protein